MFKRFGQALQRFRVRDRLARLNTRSGMTLLDQVVVSGCNFLSTLFMARLLGLEQFGQFSFVWLAVMMANTVQFAFIHAPMLSLAPKQPQHEQPVFYTNMTWFQMGLTLLLSLLIGMFVLAAHVANPNLVPLAVVLPAAITLFAFQTQDYVRRVAFSNQRPDQAILSDALSYGGQLLCLLAALAGLLPVSLTSVMWMVAVTSALGACVGLWWLPKPTSSFNAFKSQFASQFEFGWPLGICQLSQWAGVQGLLMLAGVFLGPAALGGIRVVMHLASPINLITQGTQNFVPTEASRLLLHHGYRAMRTYLANFGLILGGSMALALLGICVFKDGLISRLYSQQYLAYGHLMYWFSAYLVVSVATHTLTYYLRTIEQTRPLAWANFAATVVTFALYAVLAKPYGNTAVMMALVCNQLILNAMFVMVFARENRKHLAAYAANLGAGQPKEGVVVAFLGPDGCGKTSVIEAVGQRLTTTFTDQHYYHLRPRMLNYNSKVGALSGYDQPHKQPPRGTLVSLVKLLYFVLDYYLGYWLRVLPQKDARSLVIFDRYVHDLLVDTARFRLSLPEGVIRAILRLVPLPDLIVVLDGSAQCFHDRKQELSLEELERQISCYRNLARDGRGKVVAVDALGQVEETAQEVTALILAQAQLAEARPEKEAV
ncbi:MAG: hypothetical protein KC476_07465 [Cyanobacteria bacterium HKST-UBA06]|nr:hypothetical protein [Cyanobacteria bacterium HKST-UBA06]